MNKYSKGIWGNSPVNIESQHFVEVAAAWKMLINTAKKSWEISAQPQNVTIVKYDSWFGEFTAYGAFESKYNTPKDCILKRTSTWQWYQFDIFVITLWTGA